MKYEWIEINKKLLESNVDKNILLGNGFTIACANNNKLNSNKIIDNVHKYYHNKELKFLEEIFGTNKNIHYYSTKNLFFY